MSGNFLPWPKVSLCANDFSVFSSGKWYKLCHRKANELLHKDTTSTVFYILYNRWACGEQSEVVTCGLTWQYVHVIPQQRTPRSYEQLSEEPHHLVVLTDFRTFWLFRCNSMEVLLGNPSRVRSGIILLKNASPLPPHKIKKWLFSLKFTIFRMAIMLERLEGVGEKI